MEKQPFFGRMSNEGKAEKIAVKDAVEDVRSEIQTFIKDPKVVEDLLVLVGEAEREYNNRHDFVSAMLFNFENYVRYGGSSEVAELSDKWATRMDTRNQTP